MTFSGVSTCSLSPSPWRRWMILSKPIRQPVEGSTDSRGVDRGCGGNAPRNHPSNVPAAASLVGVGGHPNGVAVGGREGATSSPPNGHNWGPASWWAGSLSRAVTGKAIPTGCFLISPCVFEEVGAKRFHN